MYVESTTTVGSELPNLWTRVWRPTIARANLQARNRNILPFDGPPSSSGRFVIITAGANRSAETEIGNFN